MLKTYSFAGIMVGLGFSESQSPSFMGSVRTEFLRAWGVVSELEFSNDIFESFLCFILSSIPNFLK